MYRLHMDYLIAPESYESEKIRIRSWLPGDGPRLAEAARASYEHLVEWLPWVKKDQSDEEYERYARTRRAKWLLAEDFTLAILSLDGSRVLGSAGFHLRGQPVANLNAEIGMWIRKDEAGGGLGTQALECLLDWGFGDWPWERLAWRSDTRNVASRRVAEKCGMRLEGVARSDLLADAARTERRDSAWYSMLRGERG